MTKSFKDAAAFKSSLESRLRKQANEEHLPFQMLQLKFVMERLLARLFHSPMAPWLLKGGFAMDLRYRPRARTTKDIDLAVEMVSESDSDNLRELLQTAADKDLGDFLSFRIGEQKSEMMNAPGGGGRFPVECVLLGKTYAKFGIDVGIGDQTIGTPEILTGNDTLSFAGIPPARVRAITKAQQFAEKIHAYTFPWQDRLNTRTKDLVDLVLLIERGPPDPQDIRDALSATFQVRKTHPLPERLTSPPEHWKVDFPGMATEANLSTTDHLVAFGVLEHFWTTQLFGRTLPE